MKKSFLLLCLVSLMTISCQDTKNKDEMQGKLVGSWEWIRSEMPVSSEYPPETPETTGNQHLLSFTSDKTWTWLRNDTLCGEGTLELIYGRTRTPPKPMIVSCFILHPMAKQIKCFIPFPMPMSCTYILIP